MTSAGLRRILHALTAGTLLVIPVSSWTFFRWFLLTITVMAFVVDRVRLRNPDLKRTLDRYLPVFRPSEGSRTSGAVWLWAGYSIASWVPPTAPVAGILVAALADPAAAWAGSIVSRAQGKTWAGSSAAILVAVAVLLALGLPILTVACAALVGATLERWPGPFDDNLVMAPGVAATVWLTGLLAA